MQYLTKILRQYFKCNERLEICLTFFCNILCYVGNISNMAAIILLHIKKWRWGKLSQISQDKLSQVVRACVRARARARVCVLCYHTIVVYAIHHRKLCTRMFILKEKVWVFSINIFGREKIFCRTLYCLILQRTRLN